MVAQKLYTKAFGTTDIPAETWFDFQRDTLYIHFNMCRIEDSLFYKELSKDLKRVRNLALGGVWVGPSWRDPFTGHFGIPLRFIIPTFGNLETVTLVDAHHKANRTADLAVADEGYVYNSLYNSSEGYNYVRDPNHVYLAGYTEYVRGCLGSHCVVPSFPIFKFKIFIERPEGVVCEDQGRRRRRSVSWKRVQNVFRGILYRQLGKKH
jgi:hypothetical protein